MYNPELTSKIGIDFLENGRLCEQGELNAEHPYNQMLREMMEIEGYEDLSPLGRKGFVWEQNLVDSILQKAMEEGCTNTIEVDVQDIFGELLTNAVEHGAQFCNRGTVSYEVWASRRGIFTIINDPGEGFDLPTEALDQRILPASVYKDHSFRGQGGWALARPTISVNFERNQNAFRTLCLIPHTDE